MMDLKLKIERNIERNQRAIDKERIKLNGKPDNTFIKRLEAEIERYKETLNQIINN